MISVQKKPSAVLMGSKPGSVVALSILIEREWQIKYVIAPNEPSHPWIAGQTLRELAEACNIKAVTEDQLPGNQTVDFVISYMARTRIKPDILSLARRAALNFHAAPLPEYGGWAFYNIAILENASEYGCTCHYMDEGFDTGPILKVRRFPIEASQETAWSLEQKAQEDMIRLFLDFCHMAETQEKLPLQEQDKSKMRYLNRQEFEALKEIPGDADEETMDRCARAFWYPPYECAYLKVGSTKVEVVPRIVKEQLASLLHANDLERLENAARCYRAE